MPKKNTFLLVDGEYNPFLKYIKKEKFTTFYRRGEKINLNILLRCILKFNFTSIEYYKEFVKFVSTRLILTAFDYHVSFYRLSKDTSVKTLMLQRRARTNSSKIIKKSELFFSKNNKNIFYVDYVLLFDSSVCRFYSV